MSRGASRENWKTKTTTTTTTIYKSSNAEGLPGRRGCWSYELIGHYVTVAWDQVRQYCYLYCYLYFLKTGVNVSVGERDGMYLKYLVPALNRGSPYYTYQGSLTTPPCYQSVRWILLQVPAPLNPAQVSQRLICPTKSPLLNWIDVKLLEIQCNFTFRLKNHGNNISLWNKTGFIYRLFSKFLRRRHFGGHVFARQSFHTKELLLSTLFPINLLWFHFSWLPSTVSKQDTVMRMAGCVITSGQHNHGTDEKFCWFIEPEKRSQPLNKIVATDKLNLGFFSW